MQLTRSMKMVTAFALAFVAMTGAWVDADTNSYFEKGAMVQAGLLLSSHAVFLHRAFSS
jgi:hypothetical protein